VKVGKIFDNKEALDLAIRLKALDEGYQLLNDRSAPERHSAIALAVQDEFPLSYHAKWQKYMSFKPDIPETQLYMSKPMISKDYKKETDVKVGKNFENKEALDLAIRLKALDEGYQFLNNRSAPE
nr:hypothetical protein [Tanacetum cinerariifolium]